MATHPLTQQVISDGSFLESINVTWIEFSGIGYIHEPDHIVENHPIGGNRRVPLYPSSTVIDNLRSYGSNRTRNWMEMKTEATGDKQDAILNQFVR